MEKVVLSDKSSKPNDELICSILGHAELLWEQTFTYLFNTNKDISVEWKYSDCGKEWFCQARKKKKTLFWIKISRRNSFGIGFPFGNKLESVILNSDLPENIKDEFVNATKFSTTRYISIEVEDSKDFENVKKLIDLKANN